MAEASAKLPRSRADKACASFRRANPWAHCGVLDEIPHSHLAHYGVLEYITTLYLVGDQMDAVATCPSLTTGYSQGTLLMVCLSDFSSSNPMESVVAFPREIFAGEQLKDGDGDDDDEIGGSGRRSGYHKLYSWSIRDLVRVSLAALVGVLLEKFWTPKRQLPGQCRVPDGRVSQAILTPLKLSIREAQFHGTGPSMRCGNCTSIKVFTGAMLTGSLFHLTHYEEPRQQSSCSFFVPLPPAISILNNEAPPGSGEA
ncbi:hypothetical protein C8R43DRAFT_1126974 [Mycena crocata]|nr:hypothetical protein C8R43DRAFT_1126974 [Mycena crocata]